MSIISSPYTAGPLDAPIIFVGQAPGAHEAANGGAFVGPAGNALSRFCSSAGINKEACRLENLFQLVPPHDDLDPYIKLGTKKATETELYKLHKEALRNRLLQTRANIIVPMGRVSTYALTGIVGAIGKWRGSVLESSLLPGRKVLPTFHPSSTLKGDYINGYYITYDLIRAKKESAYPEIRRARRDLKIHSSFSEICAYLREARRHSLVAYDIETRGHHLSHISFSTSPTEALCIPMVSGAKDVWMPEEETEILTLISELLEDPKVEKLGQNLSFDCTFLYRHYGIAVSPIHDTMIAAAVIFPDYPKGLDFLVSIYCDGEPYYKDDGKVWKQGALGDEDTFRRYNAMDSAVLMEIFPKQVKELQAIGNWDAYIRQRDLIHPLVFAADRGLLVDVEGMKIAAEKTTEKAKELEASLRTIIGPSLNYNSSQQLIRYFYVEKNIQPYTKRRKTGGSTPSVDEKALTRLASRGFKEAQLILEIRKLEKMRSTYFEMGIDPDNRVRCSYNPVGTVQARISSSANIWGTGGNLQNQPEEMLELFVADPGGLYICLDLAQAENRVVAYEAQEMKMIEALEANIDIHSLTGALIHDIPVEQVTNEQRQDGKVANHGLNYGFGVDNFILRYELERERGKFIWNRYHRVYPGIQEWHKRIQSELSRANRILVNCYGRRRRFVDQWGPDLFEKAYNFRPQSTIAIKMNSDGVCYVYYNQDLFHDVDFANTVHDSLWVWIPLSGGLRRILDVILLLKRQLETPLTINGRSFSLPADIKIGFRLGPENSMLVWKNSKKDFSNLPALEQELANYVATKEA